VIVGRSDQGGKLEIVERPIPKPEAVEVLVAVRSTSVNRADVLQRQGNYPPPPGASDILGLEVAGEVVEIGSAVTEWRPGDRVCALLAAGGYAEYATVPASPSSCRPTCPGRLPAVWRKCSVPPMTICSSAAGCAQARPC
jgi:NADPH:quinone reductase-like Zn-dependent oxidoreductase